MATAVSVRVTPGQLAALDALVRQEGGTIAGHIRTGLQLRLDLGLHRQALQRIAREELNAAIEVQRGEWEAIRAEILQASLDTDTNLRSLMASFLAKLGEVTGGAFAQSNPEPVSAPATTNGGVLMPPRSR